MYDRILLPTDGGPTTDRALEHAANLAGTYDAELHIVYVIDSTAFATDIETGTIVEEFEHLGESIVDDVTARAREYDLERVVPVIVRGTPSEKVLEYSADHGIDLIVMGTHGRTGLPRYLLGSIAEKIVRRSDAPVLTVRTGADE